MDPSDSNAEARFQNVTRSDFWFSDGNVVLLAHTTAFKVHRGQLERHSEVFRDLFSVPQPDEEQKFDGSPYVELHDRPSDVFYFLKALYDGLYFHHLTQDFPFIAGVLRLSTKYVVEHLRERCLMRLEHDWPATLIGWDLREREATDSAKKYSPRDSYAHPILVIDLAHELGLTSVLAAAFYDLSRYGPSRIMVGAPRPQSETPLSGAEEQVIASKETYTRLSRSFLYRTFRGREHAQKYVSVFIEKELTTRPISFDCANSAIDNGRSCKDSFYFIMVNTFRSVGGIACGREADPLCTLLHAVEMLSRTDFSNGRKQCGLKICEACKADFAVSVDSARKEVWELIPGWFGLESGRGQSAAYAK